MNKTPNIPSSCKAFILFIVFALIISAAITIFNNLWMMSPVTLICLLAMCIAGAFSINTLYEENE